MVYNNSNSENADYDEQTKKVLSYAQRAQIYAMTAITALNSGNGKKQSGMLLGLKICISYQEMMKTSSGSDRQRQKTRCEHKG